MDIIERVNQIDWGVFGINDLPIWYANMLSPDPQISRVGYRRLAAYLGYFAGADSDYIKILKTDGAVILTPFILEFLEEGFPVNKRHALNLLYLLAHLSTVPFTTLKQRERAIRIKALISQKKAHFIHNLDHSDPDVRIEVKNLLAKLGDNSSLLLDRLLPELENDAGLSPLERRVNASIVLSILDGKPQPRPGQTQRFLGVLDRWTTKHSDLTLKAIGAAYQIKLMKEQASDDIVDRLTTAFLETEDLLTDGINIIQCINTLLMLDPERRFKSLLKLFDQVSSVTSTVYIAYNLLCLVHISPSPNDLYYIGFYRTHIEVKSISEGPPPPVKDEAMLKQVLEKFVNEKHIWEKKTNLFEIFGLPNNRFQAARAFDIQIDE